MIPQPTEDLMSCAPQVLPADQTGNISYSQDIQKLGENQEDFLYQNSKLGPEDIE